MSVISQREIQIGTKSLLIYTFDYRGVSETFTVPQSVIGVSGINMDNGPDGVWPTAAATGIAAGATVPSVTLVNPTTGVNGVKTVTVGGAVAGPAGRVLVFALCGGASGTTGVGQDSSSGARVWLTSPK